ncbi:MAG: SRPBCC family protein [Burkholderiales bacterium]|nr:SRPBCC family protein [Burkholderiales bacterium]
MPRAILNIDPELDLVLERVVAVPRRLVWRAWTQPEHMVKWFCPLPWKTTDAKVDLQPGGIFQTTMQGPEGPGFTNTGCILQVVDDELFVWTGTLGPGFRPQDTKYTAIARHGDVAARQAHEQMGFHAGWGKALDQLVEHAQAGHFGS